MGAYKFQSFAGMWPLRDNRALPDNGAVDAQNIRIDGGSYLRGINAPQLVKTLPSGTQMVYRIPNAGADTLVNSFWMAFPDPYTDVERAPIVNDSYERFYWASPSTGLRYATKQQILSGQGTSYVSGVPAPTTVANLQVVAGTGQINPNTGKLNNPITTRSYLMTWINEFGEESQPGPDMEATGAIDQDYLFTNIPQPPSPGAYAAFAKIRIYRTVTALATNITSYYKVVDLPVGTTYYTDRVADTAITGNTTLGSVGFAPPPPNMQGIVAMPNGIFVGWSGNTIYVSENYRPSAWPTDYQLTVGFPIVGLGVFGTNVVVCTTGLPYLLSGVKANALTLAKGAAPWPCLSRRSIVSTPTGVYWATDEGIAFFSMSGVTVVTQGLISREQWRAKFSPETLRCMVFEGAYTCFFSATKDGAHGFRLNPADPKQGITRLVFSPNGGRSIGVDPWSGKPWMIDQIDRLLELEPPGGAPLSRLWLSKELKVPAPTSFGVFEVYFDDALDKLVHLRVWVWLRSATGEVVKSLVYDQDVIASGVIYKLPSGFRSDVWQFELSGTAVIQEFFVANTAQELRGG